MSSILQQVFSDIANSIRSKLGTTDTIKPIDMSTTIDKIEAATDVRLGNNENLLDIFNSPVYIYGNKASLANSVIFNSPVNIDDNVLDTSNLLMNCKNFNANVKISNNVTNCYQMFAGCDNFNQPVIIPNSLVVSSSMFTGCNNFQANLFIDSSNFNMFNSGLNRSYIGTDSTIEFGNNITNLAGIFSYWSNSSNYARCIINCNIIIPNSVTNCRGTFSNCFYFNKPITIPDSVTDCYYMFHNSNNFNQPVTIGNNVIDCSYMFSYCKNFNQPVNIPDSVTNCHSMFSGSYTNFNSPINIGDNVTDCSYMFDNCWQFNQPVNIPENVINCYRMFNNCSNFNSNLYIYNSINNKIFSYILNNANKFNSNIFIDIDKLTFPNMNMHISYSGANATITIGDNVTDCSCMFGYYNNTSNYSYYSSFNANVKIGNNVTNCYQMFIGCSQFNKPITIPENVTNIAYMFNGCTSFNQPITIPNNVRSCFYMFGNCWQFNQPITIPENVTNVAYMFHNGLYSKMEKNIYIFGYFSNYYNISRMFGNKNNAHCVNIITNNRTSYYYLTSSTDNYRYSQYTIVGSNMTWESATTPEGIEYKYSSYYNINVYYDPNLVPPIL